MLYCTGMLQYHALYYQQDHHFLSTSFKKLKFAILKILKKSLSRLNWLSRYFKNTPLTIEPNYNQQVYVCDPKADKPLIQPTSSIITYRAINDNAV